MVESIEKFNNNTKRILLSGSVATMTQILLIVTATMLPHAYGLAIVSNGVPRDQVMVNLITHQVWISTLKVISI